MTENKKVNPVRNFDTERFSQKQGKEISNGVKISESLGKLEEIVNWFEKQTDVDVEEGLKKVKEGAAIIKALKVRLKKVETEFSEIRHELEE